MEFTTFIKQIDHEKLNLETNLKFMNTLRDLLVAYSKPVPVLAKTVMSGNTQKGKLSAAGLASIRAAQRKRRAREAAAKKAKVKTNG